MGLKGTGTAELKWEIPINNKIHLVGEGMDIK